MTREADIDGAESEGPTTTVEEVQIAVDSGTVSFPMVVRALYLQRPEFARDHDPHVIARYRALYPKALALFMGAHGGIKESFYAHRFPAGVVLTGADELYSSVSWEVLGFDTLAARELEAELDEFRLKIEKFASGHSRRALMHRVFRLYHMLISILDVEHVRPTERPDERADDDAERAPSEHHVTALDELHAELERTKLAYTRVGTLRGQARYIGGAAAGALGIVVIVGTIWVAAGHDRSMIWPGVVAGGALGALFSVLERLTRGGLDIRFESESVVIGGISRPIVGAISGSAMYALIDGGIVPLDPPSLGTARWLFFAGIAFLSGFSERFAKDAFGTVAHSLAGEAGDRRVDGDPPGDAPSA